LLLFKIYWRQHSVATMLSFWIVEEFDIIEHVLASFLAGRIGFPPDPLSLQELEKAFSNGIIVAVSPAAHAGLQVISLQELLPLITGKLAALVRMNNHL